MRSDALTPEQRVPRFWAKVRKTDTCWLWTAATTNGYGTFGVGYPRTMLAHRWSYQHHFGPIPDGMQVDHLCREPLCVRPDHLRLATNKQNLEHRGAQVNNRSSGVRGVYLDRDCGRWYVQVTHHDVTHNGGRYDTVEEAERAAVTLRNRLFTHNDLDR
jgi:hypothetical protein